MCLSQVKEDKLDSILSTTTLNLKAKKVIDIFCISQSCWETVGREIIDTKTDIVIKSEFFELNNFTAYVFWKENSKIYLQKFDYINKFNPIEIDDFGLFEMIKKNSPKIKNEKVLEYETRIGFKKVVIDQLPSCQSKLYFYNKKDLLIKEFNEHHLKTEYSDGSNKNLNYKSNSKLKMIEIFNVCDSKIEEAKENKLFHKIE